MTKRFAAFAAVGLMILAGASVAYGAAKKTHKISDTVKMRTLQGDAKLIVYTGTIKDNNFGEGALIVKLTPGATAGTFNNTAVAYFKNATLTVKGTNNAEATADGGTKYTGNEKITGGTGAAKGITGKVTLSGTAPADDPTYSSLTIKGTAKY